MERSIGDPIRALKHIARSSAQHCGPLSWCCTAALATVLAGVVTSAGADPGSHVAEVRIEQRQVVLPASRRIVVPHRAHVEIRWHADEAGVLHLHGYDLEVRLRRDRSVTTRFEAKATGRFAVTSHGFGEEAGQAHGHGALLYIEVHPD